MHACMLKEPPSTVVQRRERLSSLHAGTCCCAAWLTRPAPSLQVRSAGLSDWPAHAKRRVALPLLASVTGCSPSRRHAHRWPSPAGICAGSQRGWKRGASCAPSTRAWSEGGRPTLASTTWATTIAPASRCCSYPLPFVLCYCRLVVAAALLLRSSSQRSSSSLRRWCQHHVAITRAAAS